MKQADTVVYIYPNGEVETGMIGSFILSSDKQVYLSYLRTFDPSANVALSNCVSPQVMYNSLKEATPKLEGRKLRL